MRSLPAARSGPRVKVMATKRADLDKLAEELAALSAEERARVLSAADRRTPRLRLTWQDLRALKGLVRLGGNAVEDCDRLYDA